MKVLTIVGTRPEIIRLSAVIRRLDETVEHTLAHTGQNYDRALNQVFFDELALRPPDHLLDCDTSSLGAMLGDVLRKTELLLSEVRPDAVLVLGDTNSALALIMAKRMRIPTYHMEAGNRCFDENVPEETNRRIVDHTADFNLVYTEHARRNLLAEGIHPRRVLLTGSPMQEVLATYRDQILASPVLQQLSLAPQGYFLVSAHREETVDSPARLSRLVACLNRLAVERDLPVVVSTHPRTRRRLAESDGAELDGRVRMLEPFGFFAYNRLQQQAACVLSDSGTISEESAILGFPALTLRASIERPEALDTGSILLTDIDPDTVLAGVHYATTRPRPAMVPADYQVTDTSERVVNFILSTAPVHSQWLGLRQD
jgi:UDP-N-acetylglucosamine 2-epimerase (non-hydrolysing)